MKHGVTQTLYNYWDNLRGARPAPNRSEVDPGEIRGLLGDTFILETNGPQDVRYRLAGTRLCSAHCRELKGRNFPARLERQGPGSPGKPRSPPLPKTPRPP